VWRLTEAQALEMAPVGLLPERERVTALEALGSGLSTLLVASETGPVMEPVVLA
jgi:hypothetical protein